MPHRARLKERKERGDRWTFIDSVRYAYYFGGMYPAVMLVFSKMIESLVRIGIALRWKARLVDGLDGATFTISALGYCITLANNLHYFSYSPYMRALSQRISGQTLLLLFAIMGALSLASLCLRNSERVTQRCEASPTSRFCWVVYLVHMFNHGFAVFCLAAWAAENQLSVSAYNPGNIAPFTAFFAVTAVISLLIGISLPAPGRDRALTSG